MASRWKTFSPNTTLPASDINDCLNPGTADHLFRAVSAARTDVTIASGAATTGYVSVTLPSGRFASALIVSATPSNTSGATNLAAVNVTGVTATGFQMRVTVPSNVTSATTITVMWIAVLM